MTLLSVAVAACIDIVSVIPYVSGVSERIK